VGSPIGEQRFAVVDVETTGLSVRRHRVLQIGVVVIDGAGVEHDRWSTYVASRRWWRLARVGPTHIHGITRRDMRNAPSARDALAELRRRIDGAHLVAHNASFDVGFLARASRRAGVALPLERALCTLTLSRSLDPDRQRRHRLLDLCERYDIVLAQPHHALSDAAATAAILPMLLDERGVRSTADLAGLLVPVQHAPRRRRTAVAPLGGLDDLRVGSETQE
jgi:DNA polymerase-3 subunit epsilon